MAVKYRIELQTKVRVRKDFTIMEKAEDRRPPTRAIPWLKAPTTSHSRGLLRDYEIFANICLEL